MAAPQQTMDVHGSPVPVSSVPSQPTTNRAPEPTIPYSWREWHPNIELVYIRHHDQANKALERLAGGPYGFDLEWKPNFVKGQAENRVALVQIANHETILLLQVTAMQQFPSKLHEFLLDPNTIKVGVGIQGDAKKLYQDWNVDVKNCVDLALLARSVDNEKWKGRYTDPVGLARLIAVYENRALAKGKITRSNWERCLTVPQQTYAANDAHAGYVIYTRLMAMLPAVSPQPEPSCYTFDTTDGRLYIPFGGAAWRAFNPNYDPGPPPPPREPKPPKQNKPKPVKQSRPTVISATALANETYFPVARGPGSEDALPAPQSIPSLPGFLPSHGHRGGIRTSRGPAHPLHMQSRSRGFPSYSNVRRPHPPGNTPHHFNASNDPTPSFTQSDPFYSYEGPLHPSSSSYASGLQDPNPRMGNDI
ncbi:hypothetical protein D9756_004211 [Leucocoprinus leucothites]|uniref:3'-5' exonuclease n=1 Tax=Leucocoprinus leucothites TaxID=201217 RepID=A0A8H5G0B7_9AGAR|nr:hypothetical protein D9756_004211 [Leucoagaricus leucothites]